MTGNITGELLIGSQTRRGTHGRMFAIDAASGQTIQPEFGGASLADADEACRLASSALDPYRALPLAARAAFIDQVAQNILDIGWLLIERAMQETGLPQSRVEGERARTVGQLRFFADIVRDGRFLDIRIDSALPDRRPLPRPSLHLRNIPIGPVAVFGASNFPLAFSVAGGDTASAFAAGCPVIVKAHPAHLGTSELVGRAVQKAVRDFNMPHGIFSLLFVDDQKIAQSLIVHPSIRAVGFTGSRAAGLSFMHIAAARKEPIPVYAEMSSLNPVLLFPAALANRGRDIAANFVASLTMGAGQFCTKPGLILVPDTDGVDCFLESAAAAVRQTPAYVMLTSGIRAAYDRSSNLMGTHEAVETLATGHSESQRAHAFLFVTDAERFLQSPELQNEMFGAASLIVRCANVETFHRVIQQLEGQLTASLHLDADDHDQAREIMPLLERKVGRILVNGFGTGVEVAHGMVHGGPFPSTADGRTSSVGGLAVARFLRPVCYQDMPEDLLPSELRRQATTLPRLIDGEFTAGNI